MDLASGRSLCSRIASWSWRLPLTLLLSTSTSVRASPQVAPTPQVASDRIVREKQVVDELSAFMRVSMDGGFVRFELSPDDQSLLQSTIVSATTRVFNRGRGGASPL